VKLGVLALNFIEQYDFFVKLDGMDYFFSFFGSIAEMRRDLFYYMPIPKRVHLGMSLTILGLSVKNFLQRCQTGQHVVWREEGVTELLTFNDAYKIGLLPIDTLSCYDNRFLADVAELGRR